MDIIYITSGSENVGTYFRAFFWAKNIVNTGNRVTLISGHEKPSSVLHTEKIRDGVNVVTFVKTGVKWDYPGYILRSILIFWFVLTHHFEILHVFVGWQPPSFAAICAAYLKRILGIKFTLYCDWDDLWGGPAGIVHEHGAFISAAATRLEYLVPRLADKITVCSEFLRSYAISSGIQAGKIILVYNGANVSAIQPLSKVMVRKKLGIPLNKKVVLYMGQYQSSIIGTMLHHMKSYLSSEVNVEFYILGNISSQYQGIIQGSSRIKYLGKILYDELSLYFSAADILLLPMADSDVERARFPIRFGDYISSGTAILAAPQGEVLKLISRYTIAYTADFSKKESFEKALKNVLSDPKRMQMGQRARAFAERTLSWEHIAAQLQKLYETA